MNDGGPAKPELRRPEASVTEKRTYGSTKVEWKATSCPVTVSTFGWAVVHSLMNEKRPSPPKEEPPVPEGSLSARLPSNQPTVSSPGKTKRRGGPLSHVARARPSWYSTLVFATLILLIRCLSVRCDKTTCTSVLSTAHSTSSTLEAGLTSVVILGSTDDEGSVPGGRSSTRRSGDDD